ncbi:MAG: hypothetical protein V9E82_03090 [Candidatus Nanopelagicales bacterium]
MLTPRKKSIGRLIDAVITSTETMTIRMSMMMATMRVTKPAY